MKRGTPTDLARSVRERLVTLSHQRGENPNLVLIRYAAERLLYRLSRSVHRDTFVLKGAMLFLSWSGYPHRPTRDVDLLGFGGLSLARLGDIMAEICLTQVEDDGLRFDPETIRVEEIREQNEYGGLRVRLVAMLGTSRLPLQVDVGIGDVVTPDPLEIEFPTLLSFPAPRVRAYGREAVIAEKLHAMVVLGLVNSRMKDFFDLWTIATSCAVEGTVLRDAIAATFPVRRTGIPPKEPVAFSKAFATEGEKTAQWSAFLDRDGLSDHSAGLVGVVAAIRQFLLEPLEAARDAEPFEMVWPPGGPWQAAKKL
jgi:predicted nucleotidyltransferase component of viral defense system